ncbi:serine hydrolase domain-containing protein [Nocardia sp. NBC_01009]|uniref:serine hydrolase domain-containing protein n=1 Tax=Nocardia sp. NBC_01009 TaxID=2975996 RepID=UPI003868B70D|nr:beta-lactamase family protein [Nocardia sp. NBC_01009]
MRIRAGIVAVSAIVALTGSAGTNAVAESGGADRAALQQAMNDFVAAGAAGVQLRVRDRSGEWTGSAGVAEIGRPEGVPVDGRFRAGSITKTFIATVLLQLVDEGKLGLDDPVARYLPQFGLDHRITVRMILQHTSGLRSHTRGSDPADAADPVLVDDVFRTYLPDEIVRFVAAEPLKFDPGTGWSYSNTNYVLVGLLIEKLTGTPYAWQVNLRIVLPLGLWRTELPGQGIEILGPHAHGYVRYSGDGESELIDITRLNPSFTGASGEIISTTEDLTTFVLALASGRLLSPALMEEMRDIHRLSSTVGYGLGLFERDFPSDCVGLGHGGRMPGYSSEMLSSPDGRASVVISVTEGALAPESEAFQITTTRLASLALCGLASPPLRPA